MQAADVTEELGTATMTKEAAPFFARWPTNQLARASFVMIRHPKGPSR